MNRKRRAPITSALMAALLLQSLWIIPPNTAQAACDPPQKSRWGGMATFTDVCELGMTTSGVSSDVSSSRRQELAKSEQALQFASHSMENLSQDMARGQGEYLASLAMLLEVPTDRHAAFFTLAQEQYPLLAQGGDVSPVELIRALQTAMATHPAFAQTVALR